MKQKGPVALVALAALLSSLVAAAGSRAAAPAPLLAVASNYGPWLQDHLFAWAPGRPLRSLGLGVAPALSPDGTQIAFVRDGQLWVSRSDGAAARQVTQGPSLAPFDTVPGSPLRWSPDGTRVAVDAAHALVDVRTGAETALPHAQGISWAPDSQHVVYLDMGVFPSRLVVSRSDGSDQRVLLTTSNGCSFAWSPRADTIAFGGFVDGHSDVWLLAADGSSRVQVTNDPSVKTGLAWSPDGRRVGYLRRLERGEWQLAYVDVAGARTHVFGALPAAATGGVVSWTRDGRSLLAAAPSGRIALGDVARRRLRLLDPPAPADSLTSRAPEVLPGGAFLFSARQSGSGDTEIALVRADGSGFRPLTHDAVDEYDPSWSPDGRRLVFARAGAKLGGIYAVDANGTHARRLTRNAADRAPAYSPDATRVAFVRGRTIDVLRAGRVAQVARTESAVRQLSWTTDGRALVYGDAGAIRRVEVATGRRSVIDVGVEAFRPTLSPDGTTIAFHGIDGTGRYFRDPAQYGLFTAGSDGTDVRKVQQGWFGPTSWSPDGASLAGESGTALVIVDVATGAQRTVIGRGRNLHPAFRPVA